MSARIEVEGLRELRRDLRKLESDGGWKPELRATNLLASNTIATGARQSMLGASNPRAGSVAANTIKGLAGQSSAFVVGGLASVPWYMGEEMGSARYRQFPKPAGNGSHHIFPTIARDMPKVLDMYRRALSRFVGKYF